LTENGLFVGALGRAFADADARPSFAETGVRIGANGANYVGELLRGKERTTYLVRREFYNNIEFDKLGDWKGL
jgi:hypothetical protein